MRCASVVLALLFSSTLLPAQTIHFAPRVDRFGYDPIINHYGPSKGQLDRINVWPLHAMGLDGSGVRLGILDAGFRWRTAISLMSRRVRSEYDYVFHDSVTANQSDDHPDQDGHGTATFSAAAGYAPDSLIGPAYNATIYLAKTEDVRSEHHIEEINYTNALADMERAGVDITSSSLGYFTFDAPDTSYTRADLNGHTTIVAQALQHAAELGILAVTAEGNNGADTNNPYVESPGDADSILAVGALNPDNSLAGFSACGPTSDGRIKPDVCAPGVDDWLQAVAISKFGGTFDLGTGTSFATPLVAGACCLIKQSHPEATAQEIRRAVMSTASQASSPDTAMGWGRVNAYAAAIELGTIVRQKDAWVDSEAHLCFGIASKDNIQSVILFYHTSLDPAQRSSVLHLTADSLVYGISLPLKPSETLYYSVAVHTSSSSTLLPPSGEASITGIGNVSASLYPNPAHETIHLQTNGGVDWVLSDAAGRDLLAGNIPYSQPNTDISTSSLASGMYYLRISAPERGLVVKPVLVIH
jgi:hypothetical protein